MGKILENTILFILAGVVLGLLFPAQAGAIGFLSIWVMAIMMIISLRPINLREITNRENLKGAIIPLVLNYVLLSGIIFLMGVFFSWNNDYFHGFILCALVPPAVSVVAFNLLLGGDQKSAVLAEIIAFFLSLAIIPIGVFLAFRQSVDFFYLMEIIFILILLPVIVSRFLRFESRAFNYSKIAINLCMVLLFFILVGVNAQKIFGGEQEVFLILAAGVIITFIFPALIFPIMRSPKFKESTKVTYALFASLKNFGTAGVIALSLLGPAASLVAVLLLLTEIPLYFFVDRLKESDLRQRIRK